MSVDMRLNLLDASQEPSDEQLDALMESMIAKVRAESEAADFALAETLRMAMEQVDEERSRCELELVQANEPAP